MSNSRFDIIVPVWGALYCRTLVHFLLPSLLAPGNLPAWPYGGCTLLRLLTTHEDARWISEQVVLHRIRQWCQVDLTIFDLQELDAWLEKKAVPEKYARTHVLLTRAFEAAWADKADVLPLMADMVISDGFLQALQESLQQGIRLVMHPSPRVRIESFLPASLPYRSQTALQLPPQTLAALSLKHLHAHEQACFWDAEEFSNWPSHLYIRHENQIYAHCLHMHPLYMHRPEPLPLEHFSTIDLDYLQQYAQDLDQIQVLQNDTASACSLSNPGNDISIHVGNPPPLSLSRTQKLRNFVQQCSPLHCWFFQQPVLYCLGEEARS